MQNKLLILLMVFYKGYAIEIDIDEVSNYENLIRFVENGGDPNTMVNRLEQFETIKINAKLPILELVLENGYEDLAILLVKKGAVFYENNYYDTSPLEVAFQFDRVEFIRWLIESNRVNKSFLIYGYPLIYQSIQNAYNEHKVFDYLLEINVDVNYLGSKKLPLLFLATGIGDEYIIEELIKNGANLKAIDGSHRNLMEYYFSYSNNIHVLKLLINNGVNVCNTRPNLNESVFNLILKNNNFDYIYKYIISNCEEQFEKQ